MNLFVHTYNLSNNLFLNIFYCYIRCVNAIINELLFFYKNDVNNKNIDIIILTEIWNDINFCNIFKIGCNSNSLCIKRKQNDDITFF